MGVLPAVSLPARGPTIHKAPGAVAPRATWTAPGSEGPMYDEGLRYLSEADLHAAGLPMLELLGALAVAFRDLGDGRAEVPPKLGVHPGKDAFFHAMPALWPARRTAVVKWVGAFPGNRARGV